MGSAGKIKEEKRNDFGGRRVDFKSFWATLLVLRLFGVIFNVFSFDTESWFAGLLGIWVQTHIYGCVRRNSPTFFTFPRTLILKALLSLCSLSILIPLCSFLSWLSAFYL